MSRSGILATTLVFALLVPVASWAEIKGDPQELASKALSETEIKALELIVAVNPEAIEERSRLIVQYLTQGDLSMLSNHALWLLEHHPEASVFRHTIFFNEAGPLQDLAAYSKAEALWRGYAETSSNREVLDHAVHFLSLASLPNPFEREKWLLLGRERGVPERWVYGLALHYAVAITRPASDFSSQARIAVDQSEDGEVVYMTGQMLSGTLPNFSLSAIPPEFQQYGLALKRRAVEALGYAPR